MRIAAATTGLARGFVEGLRFVQYAVDPPAYADARVHGFEMQIRGLVRDGIQYDCLERLPCRVVAVGPRLDGRDRFSMRLQILPALEPVVQRERVLNLLQGYFGLQYFLIGGA
jgi:hypothetical protein